MLLGFKTKLKLNNQQRTALARHAGVARHAWNWGLSLTKQILDYNKLHPEEKIKFPSAIDLHKWLVLVVKSENPWYYEVSKSSPQNALRHLSLAWDRCFSKTSGVPRFKKKGRHDSFELEGKVHIRNLRKIQVPKIGQLRTYENLPQTAQPKSVTISRVANDWFISFRIEIEPVFMPKSVDIVGVDLGVKSLATLSTGKVFEGAKSYRKMERKLSRLQWLNRHKQRGSSNARKAQLKIAKLHQRIANIRKDTLHKLTTHLAKNHGTVAIEDLNVSGMMANPRLSKAVQDMGFYEFRRQLDYKTKLYGSSLVVVDRWLPSSKTCSHCGTKKETLSLAERLFECGYCGFKIDRDLNAALNLRNAASPVVSACGADEADFAAMKQEVSRLPAIPSELQ